MELMSVEFLGNQKKLMGAFSDNMCQKSDNLQIKN